MYSIFVVFQIIRIDYYERLSIKLLSTKSNAYLYRTFRLSWIVWISGSRKSFPKLLAPHVTAILAYSSLSASHSSLRLYANVCS